MRRAPPLEGPRGALSIYRSRDCTLSTLTGLSAQHQRHLCAQPQSTVRAAAAPPPAPPQSTANWMASSSSTANRTTKRSEYRE